MTFDLSTLLTIGDRVRYLREEVRKMKPAELAKALGIAQASLSQIETGSTKSPSADP
jgi:transcriptional regulator with XRE-family HTH domain